MQTVGVLRSSGFSKQFEMINFINNVSLVSIIEGAIRSDQYAKSQFEQNQTFWKHIRNATILTYLFLLNLTSGLLCVLSPRISYIRLL